MFKEEDLEKLIIDLISDKGYKYVYGDNLERNYEYIIIESDMYDFLYKKYKKEEITDEEVKNIILSIKNIVNRTEDIIINIFEGILE